MKGHVEFDDIAEDYASALNRGLAMSGENKDFYARERIVWLERRLSELGVRPKHAIDFGCGTGSSTPFLLDILGLESLLGVDVSSRSVAVAAREHAGTVARFATLEAHRPSADIDLAFCNGVFHHIPPAERARAVEHVFRSLKSGGLWAFWENNPLNPGTRLLMSRLPFDRDAVTLTARQARALLGAGGFEVLKSDHLFVFPNFLRQLRPLERHLAPLPIGAQYLVLCRKPGVS
jgi:SAM-dependent methyltransferase